jgi:RNA polymerase sigma-54 factor
MRISQGLQLKQAQSLALTPQMMQAIKLLGLSNEELTSFLLEERQSNPLLTLQSSPNSPSLQWQTTRSQSSSDFSMLELLSDEITLYEHVHAQLFPHLHTKEDRAIGEVLLQNLDDTGYLIKNCQEIANELGVEIQDVEAVLNCLHACEPIGVGARNLQECLQLQLVEKNHLDPYMAKLLKA